MYGIISWIDRRNWAPPGLQLAGLLGHIDKQRCGFNGHMAVLAAL